MTVFFTVYGKASPSGSKTVGFTKTGQHFVRDSAKGAASWKRTVAQVAGVEMADKPLLTGPLQLIVNFYLPRPKGHYGTGKNAERVKDGAPRFPIVKPDTTKLVRAAEDACNGICWRDDAQVVTQVARKRYGTPARITVDITELAP